MEAVQDDVAMIVDALTIRIARAFQDIELAYLRFYGGWVDLEGHQTPRAGWVQRALVMVPRKMNGVRARGTLITHLEAYPDYTLAGTYRNGEQKMVDCMIMADVLHLLGVPESALVLASDDHDFIPVAILMARSRRRCVWFRSTRNVEPNDIALGNLIIRGA
jgi:hypothetical protein